MKKALGIIFSIFAVLSAIGTIFSFDIGNYQSAPALLGFILGLALGWAGYVLSAIYFFALDKNSRSCDHIKGIKTQSKLNTLQLILMIWGYVLFLSTCYSIAITATNEFFAAGNYDYELIDVSVSMLKSPFLYLSFAAFFIHLATFITITLPLVQYKNPCPDTAQLQPINEKARNVLSNGRALLFLKSHFCVNTKDIAWIYKYELRIGRLVLESDLIIKTLNGRSIILQWHSADAVLSYISTHPEEFSENIIIGGGKENKARYKALVKK